MVPPSSSRWRKEYGGLRIEQARKLKTLKKENACLKKLVADSLAIMIPFLIITLMSLLMAVLLLKNVRVQEETPLQA